MPVTENRLNQISSELQKFGVTPDEKAIAAVIQIMETDQRATVKSACRKYSESVGTNHAPAQTATRSQQSAEIAQGTIQDKITAARDAVRRSTKAQIIVGGISDALADIACGNFDDLELDAIAALDEFTTQLNQTRTLLIEAETNPVPLSLAAAIEAEDVA